MTEQQVPGGKHGSGRRSLIAGVAAGLGLAVAASAVAATVVYAAGGPLTVKPAPTKTAATQPGAPTTAHLYLAIESGRMLGKPGWPQYVPANFTVPANAKVIVTIRNFDGGTAAVPALYLKVQGTSSGSEQVLAAKAGAKPQTISQVPTGGASHTFTVPQLHLNVPVPPASTVTFSFHTGAAGTYTWQCFAPCGTGATGWSGAMATNGYMRGVLTVA